MEPSRLEVVPAGEQVYRQHAAAAQDLLPHTVLKLGRSFRRYLGGT